VAQSSIEMALKCQAVLMKMLVVWKVMEVVITCIIGCLLILNRRRFSMLRPNQPRVEENVQNLGEKRQNCSVYNRCIQERAVV
jgi:hypothetical protein